MDRAPVDVLHLAGLFGSFPAIGEYTLRKAEDTGRNEEIRVFVKRREDTVLQGRNALRDHNARVRPCRHRLDHLAGLVCYKTAFRCVHRIPAVHLKGRSVQRRKCVVPNVDDIRPDPYAVKARAPLRHLLLPVPSPAKRQIPDILQRIRQFELLQEETLEEGVVFDPLKRLGESHSADVRCREGAVTDHLRAVSDFHCTHCHRLSGRGRIPAFALFRCAGRRCVRVTVLAVRVLNQPLTVPCVEHAVHRFVIRIVPAHRDLSQRRAPGKRHLPDCFHRCGNLHP